MVQIICGKTISKKVKEEVKKEANFLKGKGIEPALAVILVGENKASQIYVNAKAKACSECGIKSLKHVLDSNTSENELLQLIDKLNNDKNIDGILVQLPLPKHINTNKILETISPLKDVDGFHALNVGKLLTNQDCFVSCTPLGIARLLDEYNINVEGKDVCIVGASNIVGKPMMSLMLNKEATVTICHIKTKNLAEFTKKSDIVIIAIGNPRFLKADMIKDGAVIIDVGINRLDDGKIVGDVDFENVSKKCSYITPVPGGVGPMTIAMLLQNTIKAAKDKLQREGK